MERTTISYGGREWPAVRFPDRSMGGREVTVSVESLEDVLMDEHGNPVNDEAERVDEGIFFYVPDEVMSGDEDSIQDYLWELRFLRRNGDEEEQEKEVEDGQQR